MATRLTRFLATGALAATLACGMAATTQAITLPVTSAQEIAGAAPTEHVYYGWGWRRRYYGYRPAYYGYYRPYRRVYYRPAYYRPIIRHDVSGAFLVPLFSPEDSLMVSPSGTWGAGST